MGYWRLYFCIGWVGTLAYLGCNREVAALLRWLLTQVSLYKLLFHEFLVDTLSLIIIYYG